MIAPFRYLWKTIVLVPKMVCRQVTKFFPRDSRKVCMGSWFGEMYADNPKYLCEYLLANTDLEIIWIGNDKVQERLPTHSRLHFARKDSFAAVMALLRAKFWVFCIFHAHDLTSLPIDGGAVCINLWHGIPIKANGSRNSVWDRSCAKGQGLRAVLERIYSHLSAGEKEWLVVSSDRMAGIQINGNPANYSRDRILTTGTPRNDFLIHNKKNIDMRNGLRVRLAESLGFDPRKKIVMYLPTWRSTGKNVFCFYSLDSERQDAVKRLMEESGAVLIEKHHFHTYEAYPVPASSDCSIVIKGTQLSEFDAQELLLCADLLISDYSGAYIDFGLLARPCIHFAYDLDDYNSCDCGLAYDLKDVALGPIAYDFAGLMATIKRELSDMSFKPAAGFCCLVQYETGEACKKISEFMLGIQ